MNTNNVLAKEMALFNFVVDSTVPKVKLEPVEKNII